MSEHGWILSLVRECQCCERCCIAPCTGLMQGGLCDVECHCADDARVVEGWLAQEEW